MSQTERLENMEYFVIIHNNLSDIYYYNYIYIYIFRKYCVCILIQYLTKFSSNKYITIDTRVTCVLCFVNDHIYYIKHWLGKQSKKKTSKLWTLSKPWGGRSEQGQTFFPYECLDISLMGRGVRTLCPK